MAVSMEELQLAARNHGMPLEALRYDVTPVGLHYLLIHFDVPSVPGDWRLQVDGLVERPLSLTLDDIRSREKVTRTYTMECAGNGRAWLEPHVVSQPWLAEAVGTGEWGGIALFELLDEVGIAAGAVEVLFTGLDRGIDGGVEQAYQRSLSLADVGFSLLAYELNGEPLPPQHGFPLRLVVPGWYGMTSVKWLERITVLDRPFDGYQQAQAYRFRRSEDDPGEPVTFMRPRALMIPPGVPDFMSRRRFVEPGLCRLEGRAWSGAAFIDSVHVSTDGGSTWAEAEVELSRVDAYAWASWRFDWQAEEGDHELACRAWDKDGNAQPLEPEWNVGGYCNNAVQRVAVTVR